MNGPCGRVGATMVMFFHVKGIEPKHITWLIALFQILLTLRHLTRRFNC